MFEIRILSAAKFHFRRSVSDARGISAVEFALITPIFILMIGGIFSIGMVLRAHHTISSYAREAARGLALGYMTEPEAKQFAEKNSRDTLNIVVNAVVDPATKGNVNDRDVVVTLTITQDEMGRTIPFGNFVQGGIQSRVVMRSMVE